MFLQAQTVANFYLAFAKNLPIIPVLNKIDLKHANPEKVIGQLSGLFEIRNEEVLRISAKMGIGIQDVLEAVVHRVPAPKSDRNSTARALIVDSWYDRYRGAALLVNVKDGSFKLGQNIVLAQSGKEYEIKEIGVLCPNPIFVERLFAGQVGYLYCNMRSVKEALIGGTLHNKGAKIEVLDGFVPAKPMG